MNRPLVPTLRSATFACTRPLAHWALPGLLLWACNGRLAVLDPPALADNAGSGGAAGALDIAGASGSAQLLASVPDAGSPAEPDPQATPDASPVPVATETPCECGSSAALLAVGCGSVVSRQVTPLLSDDGETLAFNLCPGEAAIPDCTTFRWTRAGGLRTSPKLPSWTGLHGLSADGDQVLLNSVRDFGSSAIVYRASDDEAVFTGLQPALMGSDGGVIGLTAAEAGSSHLARWTRSGGLEVLGDLPFDASKVSLASTPSLSVAAGVDTSTNGTNRFFLWTEAGGIEVGLPGLPVLGTTGLALSPDGSLLTSYLPGAADGPGVPLSARSPKQFVWTRAGGVVELDHAQLGFTPGGLLLPSVDGSVLVGMGYTDPCYDPSRSACAENASAYRWTQQSGSVLLTPGMPSYASTVSADGSVVVGMATDGTPTPFVWNALHGARKLLPALADAGVDVHGWQLDRATTLSPDGRILTGFGTCGGSSTIFRAVLPE